MLTSVHVLDTNKPQQMYHNPIGTCCSGQLYALRRVRLRLSMTACPCTVMHVSTCARTPGMMSKSLGCHWFFCDGV